MFESKDKCPHNVNVTEGEDVIFTCDTKAEPDADGIWYINGKKLNGTLTSKMYTKLCT